MLSVLSCSPTAPLLPCVCRRRCTGFPSASSGLLLASGHSALSVYRTIPPSLSPPHPGKFLSGKVFPLLILADRPSSLHERCLYLILLAPHYRSYERLDSQFRPHALTDESEVLCHRMERKQLLQPAQFALFKR